MKNYIIKSAVCCFFIITAFNLYSEKKRHENPENFDSIEYQGWGGTNGVITGQIVDEFGEIIPYAAIEVYGKNIKTKADQNGYFTVRGLQIGGHYSLIINAKGRETSVARWIPIPKYEAANIGTFHIEQEQLWTNFWVVSSNLLENGEWTFSSNVLEITGYETNIFSSTEWNTRSKQQRFTPEFLNNEQLIDEK